MSASPEDGPGGRQGAVHPCQPALEEGWCLLLPPSQSTLGSPGCHVRDVGRGLGKAEAMSLGGREGPDGLVLPGASGGPGPAGV